MRAAVRRAATLILRAEDELQEAGSVIANGYLRLDREEWSGRRQAAARSEETGVSARVRPRDRCDETTRMRRARSGRHPKSQIARAIESPPGRGCTAPPSSDLHERLASWIERTVGERIDEYEEILGYHLERASHQKLSSTTGGDREIVARAAAYLASAGRRAFDRGDIPAALNLLPRAWALNPGLDTESVEARLVYAEALRLGSDFERADELLGGLEQRASAAGDLRVKWRAKMQRLELRSGTTPLTYDDVRPDVDRAIKIFKQVGDNQGLASAWDFISFMHFTPADARKR